MVGNHGNQNQVRKWQIIKSHKINILFEDIERAYSVHMGLWQISSPIAQRCNVFALSNSPLASNTLTVCTLIISKPGNLQPQL